MGIISLQGHCMLLRKWWWLWSKAGPGRKGLVYSSSLIVLICVRGGHACFRDILFSIFMSSFCSGIISIRIQDSWKKISPTSTFPSHDCCVYCFSPHKTIVERVPSSCPMRCSPVGLQSVPSLCETSPCEGLSTAPTQMSSAGPFPSSPCSTSPPLWVWGSRCLSLPPWQEQENWFSSHFTSCSLCLLCRLFLSPYLEIL